MTIQWLEQGELLSDEGDGSAEQSIIFNIPNLKQGKAAKCFWEELWVEGFAIELFTDRLRCFEDFGATARLGWTEEGLALAVEVMQRAYSEAGEGKPLWRGDSVEVVITGQGAADLHLVMAPGLDGVDGTKRVPRATVVRGSPVKLHPEALKTVEGYRLAVVIPWAALGRSFGEDGVVFNTQIYINQRQPGIPKRRLTWYPPFGGVKSEANGYPVRVSERRSAPFELIATAQRNVNVAGGRCIVYSMPSNDGLALEARYRGRVLGRGELRKSANGTLSVAEIAFSGPKAGVRWNALELWVGGELVAEAPFALTVADYHPVKAGRLTYQKKKGATARQEALSVVSPLRSLPGIFLHRVELTGLEADTLYSFGSYGEELHYSFRTIPERLTRPLTIAIGGDTLHRGEWMEEMNCVVTSCDPDFVIWGGDLADANGEPESRGRWLEWFAAIRRGLVTDAGRVVPIVPAVGNHDVRDGYFFNHPEYRSTDEWREKLAPEFYELFAFPGQPGYGALDFGGYCSLLMLDTDHTNPIAGEQTEWLEEALRQRAKVPWVFPIYHVGAYPAVKDYEGRTEASVRENWVPLFEQFAVRFAFEHHNHAYKRTHPIRGGKIDSGGIIYMGDGGWGVATREPRKPGEVWYLEKSLNTRHATVLRIDETELSMSVLDNHGREIDSLGHRIGTAEREPTR